MVSMFSGVCETTGEKANACDHEPSLAAGDGSLEVLGKAAIAAEPGEGAFDDPAFGLWLEPSDVLGSGDDVDCPAAECRNCVAQLFAAIDAVGEDALQLREGSSQCLEQGDRAVI